MKEPVDKCHRDKRKMMARGPTNVRNPSRWKVCMSTYQPGGYVKVEFTDGSTGESEWMWVKVEHADDAGEVVFGQLDNNPVVNKDLRRGWNWRSATIRFVNTRNQQTLISGNSKRVPGDVELCGQVTWRS
jgi:hypothetical protein